MKTFATTALFAGLLAATAAQAQDFRPFRAGFTYQLNENTALGDTVHALHLGAATRVGAGADSVFAFAPRTSRSRSRPVATPCGEFVRRPDNLFGASLTVRPGAEYVLAAANGATLTLRPRAAVGQAWPATATGLTAQVSARTLGTVLGRPDSLATIALSDGASVVLSKTYGLVSGPTLGAYLNPRLPRRAVQLTALPEAGLGTAQTGFAVAYDFQPGDVFLRRTRTQGMQQPCLRIDWTRDSIVSRTARAGGDSVRYQVRRQVLVIDCGVPRLSPAGIITLSYSTRPSANDQTEYLQTSPGATGGYLHFPAHRSADFNRRPEQLHLGVLTCSSLSADTLSLMNSAALDASSYRWTAPGLGETHSYYPNFTTDETFLVGYRKGAESWGQIPSMARILPARSARPAATTAAFPNPFADELTVRFELTQAQPVALELRDALGRTVLEKAAAPVTAGTQQLALPTAALPAGLYTLHLRFAGDGHREVLKVVK